MLYGPVNFSMRLLGFTLTFAALCGIALAQTPRLVKDINLTFSSASASDPSTPMRCGTKALFAATSNDFGRELWITDGTPAGTVMVKDIFPGVANGISAESPMVKFDETRILFAADDGINGIELWTSDGTPAGTQMLVNINAAAAGSSSPASLTNIGGGIVVFSATDGLTGTEVWRTDGTVPGTYRLSDFAPGAASSEPAEFTAVNFSFGPRVLFRAHDAVATNVELYMTDGTVPANTLLLKEIRGESPGSSPQYFANVGNLVVFSAIEAVTGAELWVTDGTTAGTVLLMDIQPGTNGSSPMFFTQMNGKVYFQADDMLHSYELWVTDGTAAGTSLLKDIASSPIWDDSSPYFLTRMGDRIFFSARDSSSDFQLWATDGTAAGTVLVKAVDVGVTAAGLPNYTVVDLAGVGQRLFFSAASSNQGQELWMSDGTQAGTTLVREFRIGTTGSAPRNMIDFNGVLLGSAEDSFTGRELFRSDGTTAGTMVISDIRVSTAGSTAQNFTAVGDRVFFRATDGINGVELWVSDGTDVGTRMVKDINATFPNMSSDVQNGVNGGGIFYFAAHDGVRGSELWRSDGTDAGTSLVAETIPGLAPVSTSGPSKLVWDGSKVLFTALASGFGTELWHSNGSAAGTSMVIDMNPGNPSAAISSLTAISNRVFFTGLGNPAGPELFMYENGTVTLVKDINPGPLSSSVNYLVGFNNKVFFSARDNLHGSELWTTDGTTAGTSMVVDIVPGSGASSPKKLTVVGNRVFFTASVNLPTVTGEELWVTDGTAGGTRLVKDIFPGSTGSIPDNLTALGANLIFTATDSTLNGSELWYSDGTEAGTFMLKNINAGANAGSRITQVAAFDGKVYFQATELGVSPGELWVTDGTASGTSKIPFPSPYPTTTPRNLTVAGNCLFLTAGNLPTGEELWVITPEPNQRCQPADIAADDGSLLPTDLAIHTNSGVNEGDFNAFFQGFFDAAPQCDIADDAGEPLAPFNIGPTGDNTGVNEGDYNCFFQSFFNGCP